MLHHGSSHYCIGHTFVTLLTFLVTLVTLNPEPDPVRRLNPSQAACDGAERGGSRPGAAASGGGRGGQEERVGHREAAPRSVVLRQQRFGCMSCG